MHKLRFFREFKRLKAVNRAIWRFLSWDNQKDCRLNERKQT